MTGLGPPCCPALALLAVTVLVYCACAMAGRAAENAEETWRSMQEEDTK